MPQQRFQEMDQGIRALNRAIVWADQFLFARNNPKTGRVLWTGKRELAWPNKPTDGDDALYTGTENGDIIEHIANTARLIRPIDSRFVNNHGKPVPWNQQWMIMGGLLRLAQCHRLLNEESKRIEFRLPRNLRRQTPDRSQKKILFF